MRRIPRGNLMWSRRLRGSAGSEWGSTLPKGQQRCIVGHMCKDRGLVVGRRHVSQPQGLGSLTERRPGSEQDWVFTSHFEDPNASLPPPPGAVIFRAWGLVS